MPERRNPQNLTAAQLRRLETLQTENKTIKQELARNRKELDAAGQDLAKWQKELDSVNKELALAQEELQKNRQRAGELEQGLQKMEQQMVKTDQELASAKKELGEVQKELQKTGQRHQAEQLQFLAQKTELEENLAAAQSKAEELHQRLASEKKQWLKEQEKLAKALSVQKKENQELVKRHQEELQKAEGLTSTLKVLGKAIPELTDHPPGSQGFVKAVQDHAAMFQRQMQRIAQLEAELEDDQIKLAEAEGLDSRISGLIELNRSLQDELDNVLQSQGLLQVRIKDVQSEAVSKARQELEAANSQVKKLQQTIAALNRENGSLIDQMQQKKLVPVLSPQRVSIMLNELQESLQAGMKGVEIREGEVKLKVGFAADSEQGGGFIIPSASSIAELKDGLSEINIRFGKDPGSFVPSLDKK
ncbi:hypothetical protein [Desulfonatronovibrio hydrogenovorans]|uniref:hypothetical protein n=1 Tax=Desulfonatronovibrio hydrogenovorans TaxID=53245 RepID=UPI000491FA13|nr:hypothetical protein [Desulfonatronovibrio hydrogenovorans]